MYAAGYKSNIWNFDWLTPDINKHIENIPIIDKDKISKLADVIEFKEVEQFNKY